MSVLEEGLRNIDAAPGFQCSYISTGNCSTTPLAGGATFTGEAEKTAHTDLLVYSYSDVAGTLYVDLGVVKGNYRTSIPFACAAGASEFHTVVKGYRWCRIRYVNGSGAQSTFELQTEFGVYRQANQSVNTTVGADSDAAVVRPTNPSHETALGRRAGAQIWHKYGYNLDVDTTTDPEILASFGGTFTPRTTGTTLSIVSTSTADDSGSTGATAVILWGVDANWAEKIEVVTMDGQTPVVTTSTWIGINRMAIYSAGTGLANAGTITATAVTGGATMAQMPTGVGTTEQCIYYVAADSQAVIDHINLSVVRFGSGTEPVLTFKLWVFSAVSNAKYNVATYYLDASLGNNLSWDPMQPLQVGEQSAIWLETTRDDTSVSGRIVLTRYQDPAS